MVNVDDTLNVPQIITKTVTIINYNSFSNRCCRCCKADSPITDGLNTDLHLDIGNGISLEKVGKFRYLGDMLDGCRWRT